MGPRIRAGRHARASVVCAVCRGALPLLSLETLKEFERQHTEHTHSALTQLTGYFMEYVCVCVCVCVCVYVCVLDVTGYAARKTRRDRHSIYQTDMQPW